MDLLLKPRRPQSSTLNTRSYEIFTKTRDNMWDTWGQQTYETETKTVTATDLITETCTQKVFKRYNKAKIEWATYKD